MAAGGREGSARGRHWPAGDSAIVMPARRPLPGALARVAEWQTRSVEVAVSERTWGFNSPLAHTHSLLRERQRQDAELERLAAPAQQRRQYQRQAVARAGREWDLERVELEGLRGSRPPVIGAKLGSAEERWMKGTAPVTEGVPLPTGRWRWNRLEGLRPLIGQAVMLQEIVAACATKPSMCSSCARPDRRSRTPSGLVWPLRPADGAGAAIRSSCASPSP